MMMAPTNRVERPQEVVQQCWSYAGLIEVTDLEGLCEILAEVVRCAACSALPSPIMASIE